MKEVDNSNQGYHPTIVDLEEIHFFYFETILTKKFQEVQNFYQIER